MNLNNQSIMNDVKNFLNKYIHKDSIILIEYDSDNYDIINKNNTNGINLCFSSDTDDIKIYTITNNIKHFNNINEKNIIKTSNHIIEYILFILLIDKTILDHCSYIYEYILQNLQHNNYNVIKREYIIKVVQNNSHDGFYIYFDKNSYANIGTIKNNRFFNNNSIVIKKQNELLPTINKLIQV
jgi:hypothetical protein